jgi:hypothetical protein
MVASSTGGPEWNEPFSSEETLKFELTVVALERFWRPNMVSRAGAPGDVRHLAAPAWRLMAWRLIITTVKP